MTSLQVQQISRKFNRTFSGFSDPDEIRQIMYLIVSHIPFHIGSSRVLVEVEDDNHFLIRRYSSSQQQQSASTTMQSTLVSQIIMWLGIRGVQISDIRFVGTPHVRGMLFKVHNSLLFKKIMRFVLWMKNNHLQRAFQNIIMTPSGQQQQNPPPLEYF